MKLTIPHEALLQLARDAARAADMHAFDRSRDVVLVAAPGELGAMAVGPAISVLARAPADVEAGGQVALPAHRLLETVRRVGAGAVTLAVDANAQVSLTRGKRTLRLGGRLPGDVDVPPVRPEAGAWSVMGVGVLARAIRCLAHAMPDPALRPQFAGVRLEADGVTLAAFVTDGARAAMLETRVRFAGSVTLPYGLTKLIAGGVFGKARDADAAEELSADDASALRLECALTERGVWVRREGDDSLLVGARKLVGEYPAWRALDDAGDYDPADVLLVDRAALLESADAFCVADPDAPDAVTLDWSGEELRVLAVESNAAMGVGTGGSDAVELASRYVAPDGAWERRAALNARFLRAALKSLDGHDAVELKLRGASSPVRISPIGAEPGTAAPLRRWCLIMPLASGA